MAVLEDEIEDTESPTIQTHVSVLLAESIDALNLKAGSVVVDATAGQGGHSEAILLREPSCRLVALDADPESVRLVRERLARFGSRAQVVESNFGDIATVLATLDIQKVDAVLFDLGWNSGQLASGRGFSFLRDEPLNMSFGVAPASSFDAKEIVNTWDEETLANALYGYGEEKYARRIAKAIVDRRAHAPIETTAQLVAIISDAVPALYRRGRLHFATRTFQALRMATNDELGAIERGVAGAWSVLAEGGRIAVITFHSIEDRVVKRLFAAQVAEGAARLVYKKPLAPTQAEIISNPRARSAKLRVIEKLCNEH